MYGRINSSDSMFFAQFGTKQRTTNHFKGYHASLLPQKDGRIVDSLFRQVYALTHYVDNQWTTNPRSFRWPYTLWEEKGDLSGISFFNQSKGSTNHNVTNTERAKRKTKTKTKSTTNGLTHPRCAFALLLAHWTSTYSSTNVHGRIKTHNFDVLVTHPVLVEKEANIWDACEKYLDCVVLESTKNCITHSRTTDHRFFDLERCPLLLKKQVHQAAHTAGGQEHHSTRKWDLESTSSSREPQITNQRVNIHESSFKNIESEVDMRPCVALRETRDERGSKAGETTNCLSIEKKYSNEHVEVDLKQYMCIEFNNNGATIPVRIQRERFRARGREHE